MILCLSGVPVSIPAPPLSIARLPNICLDNEMNVPKIAKSRQRPQSEGRVVVVVESANAWKKRFNSGDGGDGSGERESEKDTMRFWREHLRLKPHGELSRLFQNDNTGCCTLTL